MRGNRMLLFFAAFALLILVVPSLAFGAAKVTIMADINLDTGDGTFIAEGKAANKGLLCPSGTMTNPVSQTIDLGDGTFVWEGLNRFVCADGRGSFSVWVEALVDPNQIPSAMGVWMVTGASGTYKGLEGFGLFGGGPNPYIYMGTVQDALKESKIVIQKIKYDSPGKDTRSNKSLNGEWVQIKNKGKKAISLEGWTLRDKQGHEYTFGEFTLRPGKWVRVHTGKGKDNRRHVYGNSRNHVWNNNRDRATLKNSTGLKIDQCAYKGAASGIKVCR